jgi:hypothetical protein
MWRETAFARLAALAVLGDDVLEFGWLIIS